MTSDVNGITLRIGATLFFTAMALCVKFLAETIPVGQVVFFRSAVAMVPLVLFLVWTREFPKGLATRRPGAHVARCIMGCAAMFASFASLKFLPLAHATVIGYLAPLLAVILAWLLLRERVTAVRWVAVAAGFAGVLILVLPNANSGTMDSSYMIGVGLALAMAVFTAGAKIQIRSLALTENAGAIAFYFALTCSVAGLATWPLGWVVPTVDQLALLVGAGCAGGVAHIMMTLSYQYSEVSKLAAFEYLALVFAVIADLLFFAIVPQPVFYAAAACILAATLLVAVKDKARPAKTTA